MKEILDRLDRMDAGFQRLDSKMDAGFQKQGVQLEALQDDVKQALEGISGNRKVLDDKFAEVLQKLDERVKPKKRA